MIDTATAAMNHMMSKEDFFNLLIDKGLIALDERGSVFLTRKGREEGGSSVFFGQVNTFLWPDDFSLQNTDIPLPKDWIGSPGLAKEFCVDETTVNNILYDKGLIEPKDGGWVATEEGIIEGGVTKNHHISGKPFVIWPN